jgi:hypothetical protein
MNKKKTALLTTAVVIGGATLVTTKCVNPSIYTDHPFKTTEVYAKEGVYVEQDSYDDYKKTKSIDYGMIVNRRVRKPVEKEEVIKKAKILLGIENANNFTTNIDEEELVNTNNPKNKMKVYDITWEDTKAEDKSLAYVRLVITDDLQVVEFTKQYAMGDFSETKEQNNSLTEEDKAEIKKQLTNINPEEVKYLNFDKISIPGNLSTGIDTRIPVEEKGIEVLDQNLNKKEVIVNYNRENKDIIAYRTAGFINQDIQTPKINKENIKTHFKNLFKINPTVDYREYRQDELVKEYITTNKNIDLNTKFRAYYTYKLPEDRISMLSLDQNTLVQVNSEQTRDSGRGSNQMLMKQEVMKTDEAADSFINKSTKDIKLTDFEKEALEDASIPEAEKKELKEKFKKHLLNPKHEHSEEIKIEKRINKNNEPETIYTIRQRATDDIRLDYEPNGKELDIQAKDMSGKNSKLEPNKQYLLNYVEIVYNKTLDQVEGINKEAKLYNSNIAEDITLEEYLNQSEIYKSEENRPVSYNYKEVKTNKERKEIIETFIKERKDLPAEYEIVRQKQYENYESETKNENNNKFSGLNNNAGFYQVIFKKSGKEIKDYTYNFLISANGEIYNFSKSGDFGAETLNKARYEEIENDLNKPMLEYINRLMKESKQYIKQNNDGTIENIYGNLEEAIIEIEINRVGNSNLVKKVELRDIAKSKHQEELRNILANNYIPESLDGKSIKDKITFNELKEIIGWDINPYYDSRGINEQEILYDKAYKEAVYKKIKNTENYKNLIENLRKQVENLNKEYQEISNQPEVNAENYFEIKYPKDKYREFYNSKNFAEHLKGGEHRGLYLLDLGKSDWVMNTDWTIEDVLLNVYK